MPVKGFSAFLVASPDKSSFEDLRRYQLQLVAGGGDRRPSHCDRTAVSLHRDAAKAASRHRLPFIREPRKLPIVLSPEQVGRLLYVAPSLMYKAALSVAYGAGLRASEIISLNVEDIDTPAWSSESSRARPQGSVRDAVAVSLRPAAGLVESGAVPAGCCPDAIRSSR